jgi:hypothetical protein
MSQPRFESNTSRTVAEIVIATPARLVARIIAINIANRVCLFILPFACFSQTAGLRKRSVKAKGVSLGGRTLGKF